MPEIENLLLANHAEAINNMLYVAGGGWTDHWRGPQGPNPTVSHLGVAVSVRVGWMETNRQYPLKIAIESEDGHPIANMESTIEMGRPAGMPEGSDLRSVMAVNAEIVFPHAGGYVVRARVGDHER